MAKEVLDWLNAHLGQTCVDGTFGGGGHTRHLLAAVGPSGRVIALDRDPHAVQAARDCFHGEPLTLVHANFRDLPEVLQSLGLKGVDGILLDLGVSSDQLADSQRGFSFDSPGWLDLRFDPDQGTPAWRLISRLSEKNLADILHEYGEERFSRRIARSIVRRRHAQPIRTASELAQVVRQCIPRTKGRRERIDPATRTFQALRIAVNDEIGSLETILDRAADCLRPGGRMVVISYHSLEDRPVKVAFRSNARYEVLTKRPVRPSPEEVASNPRSRSAKLRAARRMGQAQTELPKEKDRHG